MQRERERDPGFKKYCMRVYKNDSDVRGAVNAGVASFILGFASTLAWGVISRSYFASFGVILLATLYHARKKSFNPVINMQASFLGYIMGSSILIGAIHSNHLHIIFSMYVLIMCIFHFTEFLVTAITNRRALQPDSFLLNHSVAYWIAAITSWFEFWIESYFFPNSKTRFVMQLGLMITLGGELLRKLAMVHAGNGFTHKLALSRRPDHRLCTTGVYSYCRHPGYVGWFLWCIGTQIMLSNPICFVAYTIVSWKFFADRILDEERDLVAFFGDSYTEYQEEVPCGIPFVQGYII